VLTEENLRREPLSKGFNAKREMQALDSRSTTTNELQESTHIPFSFGVFFNGK